MASDKLLVGLAGMSGAGKSVIVNIAIESGYKIVVMGDEVRKEAERRDMKPTPKNLGKLMLELRQLEGEAVIAKKCIPKMEKATEQKILVDGIRSLSEVEEFKKHFPCFNRFLRRHDSLDLEIFWANSLFSGRLLQVLALPLAQIFRNSLKKAGKEVDIPLQIVYLSSERR